MNVLMFSIFSNSISDTGPLQTLHCDWLWCWQLHWISSRGPTSKLPLWLKSYSQCMKVWGWEGESRAPPPRTPLQSLHQRGGATLQHLTPSVFVLGCVDGWRCYWSVATQNSRPRRLLTFIACHINNPVALVAASALDPVPVQPLRFLQHTVLGLPMQKYIVVILINIIIIM